MTWFLHKKQSKATGNKSHDSPLVLSMPASECQPYYKLCTGREDPKPGLKILVGGGVLLSKRVRSPTKPIENPFRIYYFYPTSFKECTTVLKYLTSQYSAETKEVYTALAGKYREADPENARLYSSKYPKGLLS